MLDEQATEIYETTDAIAERVRKLGGTTLRSIGHIARLQRLQDNNEDDIASVEMLGSLRDGNQQLVSYMREAHRICEEHGDVAGASFVENWIDEAERRV